MVQEQNGRMIRYLQSRLNDLRNENLSLRERFKTSTSMLANETTIHGLTGLFDDHEHDECNRNNNNNNNNIELTKERVNSGSNNCCGRGVGGVAVDDLDRDESSLSVEYTDEMLQQKIKDLHSLQLQLNNVKA